MSTEILATPIGSLIPATVFLCLKLHFRSIAHCTVFHFFSSCFVNLRGTEGIPQPPNKYKLASQVAERLLPVYQRLSDPQLLARCLKRQNAAESLHSVIWSVLSKYQHASLFAVEAAIHETVASAIWETCKRSEMCATLEMCASLVPLPSGAGC